MGDGPDGNLSSLAGPLATTPLLVTASTWSLAGVRVENASSFGVHNVSVIFLRCPRPACVYYLTSS